MRIGIFDSGLGGLTIALAIIRRLPQYDYLYLGDTKRVPYGNRSQDVIHEFTSQALDYLFEHDCQLVIIACNTASAEALRKSQQEYLPKRQPDKRVLGVLIPAAEAAVEAWERGAVKVDTGEAGGPIGVIATSATVESGSYEREIKRLKTEATVLQRATPLLVPLVENDGLKYIQPVLADYLAPLMSTGIRSLILGCTHYCVLKDAIRDMIDVPVISQDEVVPEKLADYLDRHPEIESKLGRSGERHYRVTDLTASYLDLTHRLTGEKLNLETVCL